ncbi:hypothetical protein D3C87_1728200 [compost metagenome]
MPISVPVPKAPASSKIATPPLSRALPLTTGPFRVQVPLLTWRFSKFRYCAALISPEPAPPPALRSTNVSVPPTPASTVPAAAKFSVPPDGAATAVAGTRLGPPLMDEPVAAMKVSLRAPVPSETLPLIVPALVKLLPLEVGLSNAMRPVIVPVLSLTKFT